jgi:GNAT superfamily N-acetyltransferase
VIIAGKLLQGSRGSACCDTIADMLTVEKLRPDDRGAWEALFRGYIDFYERSLEPSTYDRTWARLMEDERIHGVGARLNGRLVGIAQFLVHAHTNAADVCYLQDLFTATDVRGQGIGRALIEHVTAWAKDRGCSRVYWQTRESNERARRLYDQVATHDGFIVYQIAL